MDDFFVRIVDLPTTIGGMVSPNDDGTFSIYINARLSTDQQRKALDHELDHIRNDDFYSSATIEECERRH